MQLTPGNRKVKVGILAAVFVAASACVLIAVRAVVSSGPPIPHAQSAAKKTSGPYQAAGSSGRHASAVVRAKSVRPEQHGQIKQQLHPAIVKVVSPRAIPMGGAGRITLRIEMDRAGGADFTLPQSMDLLSPSLTEVDGEDTIKTYRIPLSDSVRTELYEPSTNVTLASHEGNILAVPEEGVTWKWDVPASEPGARALELEILTDVKTGAASEPWPIGTLGLEVQIALTWFQWVKYYLEQIGSVGQVLIACVSGAGVLYGAMAVLRRWFGGGDHAPGAQTLT